MNEFFMAAFKRLRLLPVLIVVASLAFMVRIGDTVIQVKYLRGSAHAQSEKTEETATETAAAKPAEEPPAEAAPKPADTAAPPPEETLKNAADPGPVALPDSGKGEKIVNSKDKTTWADSESDLDDAVVRKEIYDDLMQRRQIIEQKEKEIAQREALLKAGTEEINKKVEELTSIKNEIEGLLKKQNTQEEASTERLVKIYEGMKPKDAARIFNQLDMDVLISVVTKMSERKSSPIIAVMEPDKARSLTLFLSEQNKLSGPGKPAKAGFGDALKPPAIPESAIR